MKFLNNLFTSGTLIELGGLGTGNVAGKLVNNKVTPMILKDADTYAKFGPAVLVVAGMLISKSLPGKFTTEAGKAMIASGVGNYLGRIVDPSGEMGLRGVEDVLMGATPTLMGNTGGKQYGSPESYDYTASEAGEMDY